MVVIRFSNYFYFFQIQCQLFCTDRSYCDFVVWTKKDIHVERVYPDEEFWAANVIKAELLFQRSIIPELVGKFYSRQPQQTRPILIDQPDGEIPEATVLSPRVNKTHIMCTVIVSGQKGGNGWM